MLCDCSCDIDDGVHAVCFSAKVVLARKPHHCIECGCEIPVGTKYERAHGLWDGYWDTYHTCVTCARIRSDFCGGCFVYGQLASRVLDCLGVELC